MTMRTKKDIKTVLDYLWHDEEIHYHCGPSKRHVFIVLRRLTKDVKYRAD